MEHFEIDDIYNDADYWLIAFCVTPWHITSARAFIEFKIDNDSALLKKKSAIIIVPHPKTGYCIEEEKIRELGIPTLQLIKRSSVDYNRLSFKECLNSFANFKTYRSKRTCSGFVLSTLEPYIFCEIVHNKSFSKKELVILDEGVSSYLTQYGYIKHSLIESGRKIYAAKLATRLIISSIFKRLFNIRECEWLLFDKNNNYVENNKVSEYYRKQYVSKADIDLGKRYILYLSQPAVSEKEEKIIPLLLNNIARICKDYDIQLYIKAHPRDNISKLNTLDGATILPYSVSIEKLYSRFINAPLFIIGFRSTALLTLKAFYGAKCISVLGIIKNEFRKKENYDEHFFRTAFSSQFMFPKNFIELNQILRSDSDKNL